MNQRNASMTVIGAGSYGTALAITLARNGHEVVLWGHDPEHIAMLERDRCNAAFLPDVPFPDTLHLESDLATALAASRNILVVVPSHVFGEVLRQIKPLMRMSEISRIRVGDLDQTGDTVTLHISHTKTITTAAGLDKVLSRRTTAVLNDWLDVSGLREHPDAVLFPPIHRSNKARITTTPLTAPAMEKIFSDAWVLLNKRDATPNKGRYRTWTGHSARVGAAIDMAEKQVSMVEIMQEGTWKKPETLMRYLRRGGVSVGANSRLMDS
ncbi:tyrosine-type recombinase/integrase [Escherichia coli]|nr:tyrosine-type recombinase/integrase [Escherichia coli]